MIDPRALHLRSEILVGVLFEHQGVAVSEWSSWTTKRKTYERALAKLVDLCVLDDPSMRDPRRESVRLETRSLHGSALQKEDVEVERCCTHRSFSGDDQSRRADEQQQLEKTKHREKLEGSEEERQKLSTISSFYAVRIGGRSQYRSVGVHRISSRPPPTSPSLRRNAKQWNRSDVREGG